MKTSEKGQTLLVVVLIMIIALTVGLSVAARSITNIKFATDSSDSLKAFQGAEAGLEEALGSSSDVTITSQQYNSGVIIDKVTTTEVSGPAQGGNNFYFIENNGLPISQDDGTDIWLSTYSTDLAQKYLNPWSGNLTIYWGKSSDACNDAALEILVISGTKNAPIFNRYAVDPCSTRAANNKFTVANTNSGNILGQRFYYAAALPTISSGLVARIVPFYSSTPIAIAADNSATFPSQGRIITSSATSGSSTRKIVFFQGYDSIPSEFFYSLFTIQ